MTKIFEVHPQNPQARVLDQAAQLLSQGGLVAIPTDSSYAVVARLDDKTAAEALRRVRGLDERHHLTILCRDLSEISTFARVGNVQYRLLKLATPGPWTFILEATKEVPRRVSHPSRKTIGIRVPDNKIVQQLVDSVGSPLLSTTLIPEGATEALNDIDEIAAHYKGQIAGIVDGGPCAMQPTTVIDLTSDTPEVLRRGAGDPAKLGLD